jgi:hypothetical protein
VLATPGTFRLRKLIEIARALHPAVRCDVRSHNESRRRAAAQRGALRGVRRRA